jgi:penicillin V acylase-like amidase (Ntn superfamily)
MKTQIVAVGFIVALASAGVAHSCTAFLASHGDIVLAGNNEDYVNPQTKVWFVPADDGRFGRVYFGFDNLSPEGGMNERGLFFDGFATAPRKVVRSTDKPVYTGALIDKVMAECATVEEVLAVFEQYNLEFMERAMLMFGDATGDSAIIEGDDVVRKQGRFQVVTNFYQSQTPAGQEPCERYRIAVKILEEADEVSVPLCRRVLSAVHVEGGGATLYSNIYDLRRRRVYLYHFHNFENVVVFDLAEELKKGKRILDLPSLFPPTFAAEEFARRQLRALEEKKGLRRVDIDPGLLDRYVGRYQLSSGPIPGLVVTMLKEGDRLFVEVPGMGKVELCPESPADFFYLTFGGLLKLTFTEDDEGRVTGFEADMNGQKVKARRIIP